MFYFGDEDGEFWINYSLAMVPFAQHYSAEAEIFPSPRHLACDDFSRLLRITFLSVFAKNSLIFTHFRFSKHVFNKHRGSMCERQRPSLWRTSIVSDSFDCRERLRQCWDDLRKEVRNVKDKKSKDCLRKNCVIV